MEESTNAADWPRSSISSMRGHCNVCLLNTLPKNIWSSSLSKQVFQHKENCKSPLSYWLWCREVNKINRMPEVQGTKDFITFSILSVLSEFKEKIASYHWSFPIGLPATIGKPQGLTSRALSTGKLVQKASWLSAPVSDLVQMCLTPHRSMNPWILLSKFTSFSFSKLINDKTNV